MDIELVRRAQAGDEGAFASLAVALGDRLHNASARILRDLDLAEDATQQAIVSIWRDLPQLRERALPHRTARSAVADLFQAIGVREHERPAGEVEDVELDEVDTVRDRFSERTQGVLRGEVRGPSMTDSQHAAVAAAKIDHSARRRAARRHHHASGARTIAWPTAIAAASRETSSQNRSG